MKRILSIGLSIISALTVVISATGCAVQDWANQAFCEHKYADGIITKEATCKEEGEITSTCTLCGKEKIEKIKKTAHVELYVASKNATCAEKGHTDYVKCKVCDTVIVAPTDIPVLGHKIVEDAEIKATCLASGLSRGEHCEVCGEVFVEQTPITATGHSLVIVKGKPATCTETGLTDGIKCENCNQFFTEQEEIPQLVHVDSNNDLLCDNCDVYLNLDKEVVLATSGDAFTEVGLRFFFESYGSNIRFKSLPTNIQVDCDFNFFEVFLICSSKDEFCIEFYSINGEARIKNLEYFIGDGFVDFYIENKTYDLEFEGEVVGTVTFNEDTLIPSDFVQEESYPCRLYKLV